MTTTPSPHTLQEILKDAMTTYLDLLQSFFCIGITYNSSKRLKNYIKP